MDKKNIFLGKLQKDACFVNNGKYGYFLTCDKKNYKIPEWLKPEELTLDMAERLIQYKKKISEQWLEKVATVKNESEKESENESDSESEGEPPKKEMVLTKINKK